MIRKVIKNELMLVPFRDVLFGVFVQQNDSSVLLLFHLYVSGFSGVRTIIDQVQQFLTFHVYR